MIRMYSPKGGYMDCYNAREVKVAESKGWVVVPETVAEAVAVPVKKAPAKKAARKKK